MKKIIYSVLLSGLVASFAWASDPTQWEKKGNFYYLSKKTRDNFSATGAGVNKLNSKYLTFDGVDFLVRGAEGWRDYGRLNLDANNMVALPIRSGMKIDAVHFLAGGNFGNSYKHDSLLRLYGDNYYYAVVNVLFVYVDGVYKMLSVPIFWDWFHLGTAEWSKDGATIKSVGKNPARKDCSMYHLSFVNPRPAALVKDILISDSWLSDIPFSDIFAVTLQSSDVMEAVPQQDQHFDIQARNVIHEPADTKTQWPFAMDLDGWNAGCSDNWDVDAFWQAEGFARKGLAVLPGCNWAGDKFSWIEKKIALPAWEKIVLHFLRHSATYSELNKQWSDGLLKVMVKGTLLSETVYEKVYSGEWVDEAVDLSRFKGQTVIIRFENHGAGTVKVDPTNSPTCDADDAIIGDIRLINK